MYCKIFQNESFACLVLSTLKTQYQVDHQNIVVAIARFKSAIADLQYDAATTSDPNQKAQDQQLVAQYKNAVMSSLTLFCLSSVPQVHPAGLRLSSWQHHIADRLWHF